MDKTDLLEALRATHAPIEAAAAVLGDEALFAPAPGLDGWTRKDVLAHVEWCTRYAADVVEGLRTGVDPDPESRDPAWDVDVENARILEENRDRAAAEEVEGNSTLHYREHVAHLR